MRFVLLAALATFSWSASAATVITRVNQQQLVAAAKAQRDVAIHAEVAATHFAGVDEVEAPLRRAISDWDGLHFPDQIKDAFGACHSAVVNMLSLMVEVRMGTTSSPLAAQNAGTSRRIMRCAGMLLRIHGTR